MTIVLYVTKNAQNAIQLQENALNVSELKIYQNPE